MSTSTKPTGIIYRAFNKISNKSYIGQSKNDLETRKRQHYYKAREKNSTYKFVNALRLYPEDSWLWEVLLEVEVDKLNDYELFFIQDLDTFNSGYNSRVETYKAGKKYINTIYELYHKDYGLVSGTIDDFRLIDVGLAKKLCVLTAKNSKSYKGWMLPENIGYEPPIGEITLIHYEHGAHTMTRKEFIKKFNLSTKEISSLTRRVVTCCKGWVSVENKDRCDEIWGIVTLTHPLEGTFTLPPCEFKKRFGLTTDEVSQLKTHTKKSNKNWTLVKEE